MQVDPQLLFQRLIVACNRSDDLQGLFRYELCSYPAALFDSSLTLRQPQKPVLADAIWAKLSSNATSGPEGDVQHVLDGGALLHRIPWPRGSATYQDIRGLYCSHVTKKYGNAIVVFDGYDDNGHVYKEHDTPEESSRESRSNCHLHREHESHTEEGQFPR